MERSAQVDVLAQLLGLEEAKRVTALVTLAEAVVGLNEQVMALQQQQRDAAPPPASTAVYAVDDEEAAA